MKNLRFPTRMGYLSIFLFLLNVFSIVIGFFTDNGWFILLGILLSSIQYYMYGTIDRGQTE
ncbi:hypothetical protein [Mucilaginibacter puniceus]